MRVVVVGAGVIGLLTAVECVRAGAEVDVLDQDAIPSPAATSYDRARAVRALHRGDPSLTVTAARAHGSWLQLERLVGSRFYRPVGALTAMPAPDVPGELALLTRAGATAWALSPRDVASWYPWIRLPAGRGAVLEATAGTVLADRALSALAGWLRDQPGARLHRDRRVVHVDEATGRVTCSDATVTTGDRVVVAAGPWSRDLLPAEVEHRLTLYRQTVLSYRPARVPNAWASAPVTIGLGADLDAWLLPQAGDATARLSSARACRAVPEVTDRTTPAYWRDLLVDQFRTALADFDPAGVLGATDGYYLADTESGGPVLTSYGDGRVWAYAACGGGSFKLAPLVASSIARRVVHDEPAATTLRQPAGRVPQLTATGRRER